MLENMKKNKKIWFGIAGFIVLAIVGGCIVIWNLANRETVSDDPYRSYYEIFVGSFYDSDEDGIGDLNGIVEKLDYIQDGNKRTNTDLGFEGIWLMPIMPSTTYHKYDVTDYYQVAPEYGTVDDFEKLVKECHKRDVKLIIDLVINHTSAKHPWFLEATDYLMGLEKGEEPDATECPYVNYYHFTKETNGNESFYRIGDSDWYYEAVFWDQMPDLALEQQEVRAEIEKICDFWIGLGVDGFRLDAAKEFFTGDSGKNIEVLHWFTEAVKQKKSDSYVVAEVWDTQAAIAEYYKSGVTSQFNFPASQYNGSVLSAVRKLGTANAQSFTKSLIQMDESYATSNQDYIDVPFLSNHDTTRISAQCVDDLEQMKFAAGILLTMKGNPFVYYGEEIGMNSMGKKDENKRLPMHWSDQDPTGVTQAPENADEVLQKFQAVDLQISQPDSILSYYRDALAIRKSYPELARGKISMLEQLCDKELSVIQKEDQDTSSIIVYNFSKEEIAREIAGSELSGKQIVAALYCNSEEAILAQEQITIPGYAILILK